MLTRRAVFGGTFDPVHRGHLSAATEVRDALGIEDFRFLPAGDPPHRSATFASPAQRLAMLDLALADRPGFTIDRRELEREGPSYMVDTLASLRSEYPEDALLLVVGQDALNGLDRWHDWRRLPELAHLVVMTRPGKAAPGRGELADFISLHRVADAATLKSRSSGLLLFHPVTQLEISGTQIRKLLASGNRADFLLPKSVLEVIFSEGLYGTGTQHDG